MGEGLNRFFNGVDRLAHFGLWLNRIYRTVRCESLQNAAAQARPPWQERRAREEGLGTQEGGVLNETRHVDLQCRVRRARAHSDTQNASNTASLWASALRSRIFALKVGANFTSAATRSPTLLFCTWLQWFSATFFSSDCGCQGRSGFLLMDQNHSRIKVVTFTETREKTSLWLSVPALK